MMNQYLVSLLEQKLKDDPGSRVFLRLAEEFRKGEHYEKAVEVCVQGLTYHSDYVPALVCLGRCQRQLGQHDEAEKVFRQVISMTPDNPHALRGLGEILDFQRRYGEALEVFETLSLHEPGEESVEAKIQEIQAKLVDPGIDEPLSSPEEPATFAPEDRPANGEPALGDRADAEYESAAEGVDAAAGPVTGDGPSGDQGVDDIDLEFERAIHEAEERESLLFEAEESQEENVPGESSTAVEQEPTSLDEAGEAASVSPVIPEDEELEDRLTLGLKHEKMEHFEEARDIYRSLLRHYPNPAQVREHLERVIHLMENESKTRKKIRILSNWLDRIKGVYDVS